MKCITLEERNELLGYTSDELELTGALPMLVHSMDGLEGRLRYHDVILQGFTISLELRIFYFKRGEPVTREIRNRFRRLGLV